MSVLRTQPNQTPAGGASHCELLLRAARNYSSFEDLLYNSSIKSCHRADERGAWWRAISPAGRLTDSPAPLFVNDWRWAAEDAGVFVCFVRVAELWAVVAFRVSYRVSEEKRKAVIIDRTHKASWRWDPMVGRKASRVSWRVLERLQTHTWRKTKASVFIHALIKFKHC